MLYLFANNCIESYIKENNSTTINSQTKKLWKTSILIITFYLILALNMPNIYRISDYGHDNNLPKIFVNKCM